MKAAPLHECSLTPGGPDDHAKGDAAKGVEHAKVTRHSQSAASQTDQASVKNPQQSNQYGARRRAHLAKLNPAPSRERMQLVRI